MTDIEEKMAQASQRQEEETKSKKSILRQRYGSTPPSSEDEREQTGKQIGHTLPASGLCAPATSSTKRPESRLIDGRWFCLYENDALYEYTDNEWKQMAAGAENEKWRDLYKSKGPVSRAGSATAVVRKITDGVPMVWNPIAQTWLPDVAVDEDFIAHYQLNYGVAVDYDKVAAPEAKKPEVKMTKEEKRTKKRELAAADAERLKGWIEMDETRNTKVYVSGLPSTITEEEFITFMTKCGVIMIDPRNGKPKVKLYKDDEGNLKGDGVCCYARVESVQLALDILDGMRYDPHHTVHVERAKFQMKGTFDPTKKKARLTATQKKKFLEKQQKLFEWKPEKPRNYRPIHECTVVLKNMFTLEAIDLNAALIFDLKEEMKEMYGRFGILKSVVVYDTNPEGVITLTYENVEAADLAVRSLNGVIRDGRQIFASLWDGKTKYKMAEAEAERARRDEGWTKYLEEEDDPTTSATS